MDVRKNHEDEDKRLAQVPTDYAQLEPRVLAHIQRCAGNRKMWLTSNPRSEPTKSATFFYDELATRTLDLGLIPNWIDATVQKGDLYVADLMTQISRRHQWFGEKTDLNLAITQAHFLRVGMSFLGCLGVKWYHDEQSVYWITQPVNSHWRYLYVLATAFDAQTHRLIRTANIDVWFDMLTLDLVRNYSGEPMPWHHPDMLAKARKEIRKKFKDQVYKRADA